MHRLRERQKFNEFSVGKNRGKIYKLLKNNNKNPLQKIAFLPCKQWISPLFVVMILASKKQKLASGNESRGS